MESGNTTQKMRLSEKGDKFSAEVTICNRRGLHARASAKFVQCANSFSANIQVTRCGETVGGTSIMGLMMLAAAKGSTILIESEGAQAEEAIDALISLVESRFLEDE